MLIASSEYELQALLTTFRVGGEGCQNNGLSLNANKTKVLKEMKKECNIRVNGKILEQANEVVCLGSMFSGGGKY